MDVDLSNALSWVSDAVVENTGHPLRGPEVVILKGTWRGLTYEQMAEEAEYSTNYLMRDVAPKLWRQLSKVFGKPVGKTNFRIALETYVRRKSQLASQQAVAVDTERATAQVIQENTWQRAHRLGEAPVPRGAVPAVGGRLTSQSVRQASSPLAMSAALYGYDAELAQAKQWLQAAWSSESEAAAGGQLGRQAPQSCLMGIWGLKGVGKSLFCEAVVAQMGGLFKTVVWRSLKGKPTLTAFCNSLLASLDALSSAESTALFSVEVAGQSAVQFADQTLNQTSEQPLDQSVVQLLDTLTARPTLLVVEGVESILRAGTLVGEYQPEYRAYNEFFQAIAGTRSCLLLTGTESPADWANHARHQPHQHAVYLTGLSVPAATALLENESLSARDHWPELIARYQGHPAALLSAARVIRDMFNGRVDTFLQQTSPLFTDILRLLTPAFERLSEQELNILYWLASQREPLSLPQIQQTLPAPISATELLSALDSLKQRSFLSVQTTAKTTAAKTTAAKTTADCAEFDPKIDCLKTSSPSSDWPKFQLPPLIKTYAMYQLMAQFKRSPLKDSSPTDRDHFRADAFLPGQIINLSSPEGQTIQLSQWFHGHSDVSWRPLSQLLETSAVPSLRLRSTYHLRDETFIKRCKSVSLDVMYKSAQQDHQSEDHTPGVQHIEVQHIEGYRAVTASAILVMAIREEAEKLYKVCVQVQPARDSQVLPEGLELRLLDPQKTRLASVRAVQADTFIQLPYFQGQTSEAFEIELALGDSLHAETFFI
ncbi:MAG: DUF1822 family protein [Cyanobacteria bacterium J06614_10]